MSTLTNRHGACRDTIRNCEHALGRLLTVGEKADLLLDHFAWIRDSLEAHAILAAIGEEFGPRR